MSANQSDKGKPTEEGEHGPQGTVIIDRSDLPEASGGEGSKVHGDPVGKPVLVGLTPPFDGQRFPVDTEFTQVGRKAHNTVVIDDPSVSWEHAHMQYSGGSWRVLNVLSTNGTFVNGWQIHESRVTDGDRVAFGNVAFEFRLYDDDRPMQQDGQPPAGESNQRMLLIGAAVAAVVVLAAVALLAL